PAEHQADQIAAELVRAPGWNRLSSSGSSSHTLDPELRAAFGNRLGVNLSGVRIRTDQDAAAKAEELGAAAYTVDGEISFARGSYDPTTTRGRHLVAHELVHVSQEQHGQSHGVVRRQLAERPRTSPARVAGPGGAAVTREGGPKKVGSTILGLSDPEL